MNQIVGQMELLQFDEIELESYITELIICARLYKQYERNDCSCTKGIT